MGMGVRRDPRKRSWLSCTPFGNDNRKARRIDRARRKADERRDIERQQMREDRRDR